MLTRWSAPLLWIARNAFHDQLDAPTRRWARCAGLLVRAMQRDQAFFRLTCLLW
jgi:hypothetical protein